MRQGPVSDTRRRATAVIQGFGEPVSARPAMSWCQTQLGSRAEVVTVAPEDRA